MRRLRVAVILVILSAVSALATVGWLSNRSHATEGVDDSNTVRVRRGTLVQSLLVSGELAGVRAVRIAAPPFRGQGPFAIKALAPEGSSVQPGDLLVQIDNSTMVNNLATEELNLEKAENDLARKRAELEIQTKDLEIQLSQNKLQLEKARMKAEIARELISLRDWQDNQFARQKTEKEFAKTTASLELAKKAASEELKLLGVKRDQIGIKIDGIKADITALEIRADRPGTVLYEIFLPSQWSGDTPRKIQVGDQIYWGWTLLTLPDLSEMEVRMFVSEVDGGLVRPGQLVRMVADSHPEIEFTGRVQHVPELAEKTARRAKTRAFLTTVKLDKTDSKLMRPGMSVRAEIILAEREGLLLPRKSISTSKDQASVQLPDGRVQPVQVKARNAVLCLVEGIAEGTEVRQ